MKTLYFPYFPDYFVFSMQIIMIIPENLKFFSPTTRTNFKGKLRKKESKESAYVELFFLMC